VIPKHIYAMIIPSISDSQISETGTAVLRPPDEGFCFVHKPLSISLLANIHIGSIVVTDHRAKSNDESSPLTEDSACMSVQRATIDSRARSGAPLSMLCVACTCLLARRIWQIAKLRAAMAPATPSAMFAVGHQAVKAWTLASVVVVRVTRAVVVVLGDGI
jgi:hypothetical protein